MFAAAGDTETSPIPLVLLSTSTVRVRVVPGDSRSTIYESPRGSWVEAPGSATRRIPTLPALGVDWSVGDADALTTGATVQQRANRRIRAIRRTRTAGLR